MEQIKAVQGNIQPNRWTPISNEFKQELQIQVQFLQLQREEKSSISTLSREDLAIVLLLSVEQTSEMKRLP